MSNFFLETTPGNAPDPLDIVRTMRVLHQPGVSPGVIHAHDGDNTRSEQNHNDKTAPAPEKDCPAVTIEPDPSNSPSPEIYPDGSTAAWLVVLGSWWAMAPSMGLLNTIGVLHAWTATNLYGVAGWMGLWDF
jgi:hypothetical protein